MNPLQSWHKDKVQLKRAVSAMGGGKVLIIGDAMLDEYLVGDTERISPEAPVPVVLVSSEKQVLGGAGNVARNIHALGGKPRLIAARGNDAAGATLETCLAGECIDCDLLVFASRPTTIKTRVLARQQQMLRIDREHNRPLSQEETAQLLERIERQVSDSKAIIISDYGKGLISAQLMQGLLELLKKKKLSLPVLVDPKPQNMHLYTGVTLLTPNTKETGEGAGLPVRNQAEILLAGRAIMDKLQSKHLITTLGAQGMAVFEKHDRVWHIPTMARSVFDVTGAGDTVIAATALSLAGGNDLLTSSLLANYAAGVVVGEVGAATVTPNFLKKAIEAQPLPDVERWV